MSAEGRRRAAFGVSWASVVIRAAHNDERHVLRSYPTMPNVDALAQAYVRLRHLGFPPGSAEIDAEADRLLADPVAYDDVAARARALDAQREREAVELLGEDADDYLANSRPGWRIPDAERWRPPDPRARVEPRQQCQPRPRARQSRASAVRRPVRHRARAPGSSSDSDSADPPLGGTRDVLALASERMVAYVRPREAKRALP